MLLRRHVAALLVLVVGHISQCLLQVYRYIHFTFFFFFVVSCTNVRLFKIERKIEGEKMTYKNVEKRQGLGNSIFLNHVCHRRVCNIGSRTYRVLSIVNHNNVCVFFLFNEEHVPSWFTFADRLLVRTVNFSYQHSKVGTGNTDSLA